ncbi:hypothetical protein BJ138DRAFT_1166049 [Hygrophoropsis aurantiaca]|uniref:Uncharacterized protein n=1 Tax=Hygrophoropsis aurantiaca TaxID=72124 RepID=A0ACB7ZVI0_9AGAM|nr:hypothetical protein BJ138DRAFT_1166049 [Hygrophoropsis aurantiaca]
MLGVILCILAINSVYLLLLTHPLDVLRIGSDSLRSRLYWVYTASISFRGIGWNTHAKNIPAPPAQNRIDFVLSTVLRAVRQLVLFDAAQLYVCYNPVCAVNGPASVSITSQGYLLRCASIVAWGAMTYSSLNVVHSLFAVVDVALGLSEVSSWPQSFGRWKDSYTLRKFWGRIWHQLLRQVKPLMACTGQSITTLFYIASQLHCEVRCKITRLRVRIAGLFIRPALRCILSGAVHVGGDTRLNAKQTGFSWPFFILQAMAITFKDAVIGLARRVGFTKATPLTRLVGYLWVWSWFYASYPAWIDGQIAAGFGNMQVPPFSPIMAAIGLVGRLTGSDQVGSVLPHRNSSAVL